jgi:D-alanyl-D-alanine carboxypeptidase
MQKNKILFWGSIIAICAGCIIGFQNQVVIKNDSAQNPISTLDYIIPVITNNPIVKSIEAISFGQNSPVQSVTPPQRTTISALAYGTYYVSSDGQTKNLIGQNLDTPLRIASITKLMTALVATNLMNKNDVIQISEDDLVEGTLSRYKVGDKLTLDELLYSLLIESDNEAAQAIANHYGLAKFIQAMNAQALNLGMANTKYYNPSGLDSPNLSQDNLSTVSDLTKLAGYMELKYPNIFAITALGSYKIMDAAGNLHHVANSTDKLIDEFAVNFMVGGKTGYTGRAKQNLIILRAKNGDEGYYVDTVLSSDDRFGDMKLLIGKNAN